MTAAAEKAALPSVAILAESCYGAAILASSTRTWLFPDR
jgi:hypothetical protein